MKKIKSLVIEDNPDHAELITRYIEGIGDFLEPQVSSTLESGLTNFRDQSFDIVFLDLTLPDCDQQDTVAFLRKRYHGPVIVLTSLDDFGIGMRCIREGADDFFSKGDLPKNKMHFLKSVMFCVERNRLHSELEKTVVELQRKNDEVEQFAFVASHDLQAPLRHIVGNIDIITEEIGQHSNRELDISLEAVARSAGRMQSLIKDLLTFSRVGRFEVRGDWFEFEDVFKRVTEMLAIRIARQSAQLVLSGTACMYGDPDRIEQLLQNLLENALKFVKDGVDPEIIVTCSVDDEVQRIVVEDNGVGIAENLQEKIFQIFQRAHRPSQFEGTGIGLAICKKIVDLHDGSIVVQSDEGKGSRFIVELKCPARGKVSEHESPEGKLAASGNSSR